MRFIRHPTQFASEQSGVETAFVEAEALDIGEAVPCAGPKKKDIAWDGSGIARHGVVQKGSLHDDSDFNELVIVRAVVSVVPVKFRHNPPNRLEVVLPTDSSERPRFCHGGKIVRRPDRMQGRISILC